MGEEEQQQSLQNTGQYNRFRQNYSHDDSLSTQTFYSTELTPIL